jgi:hypothetical protein
MPHAAMEKRLVNIHSVMDQTGGEIFNVQDVNIWVRCLPRRDYVVLSKNGFYAH